MKVSVEKISEISHKIHVELSETKVKQQLKKAYRELNRNVKVRGFRPGKVPLAILKRQYGDQVNNDVGLDLINETLVEALEKTEVEAISQSDLDRGPLREGEPFRYSFLVEVKPELVVTDYLKIPARRAKLQVTEEEVDAEMERRRHSNAYLQSLEEERPLQGGDHAVLDMKAFTDGKPVPDGETKGFVLELGSNHFNPEFEAKLIGASKGDRKEIEVTFPEDYGNKKLAGRNTTFQVEVKDVKEMVLPELDDDFAKDLGEFENLAELRNAVRAEIEADKKNHIDREVGEQLLDELLNRNTFAVPKAMVERELQRMVDAIRSRLSMQNITLEQTGTDENALKERNRESAERKVRISILLEKIADQEGVDISDEELDERFRKTAAESNQPYEKIREFYQRNNLVEPLRQQLMEEKVIAFLTDQAEISELDAEATNLKGDPNKEEENA
ncbi:MAG: trigger factor [Deltaproteobacteria bacterium]|nr:MAG: trigger factor [Deltaproteobacteria bacterium]